MSAHCRIGRVKLKAGGAEVRIFANPEPRSEKASSLVRNARGIAGNFDEDVSGYVLFAWDSQGRYSFAYRFTEGGPIPFTLLPAYVADVVRREIVTAEQVRNVVDDEYVAPGGPAS